MLYLDLFAFRQIFYKKLPPVQKVKFLHLRFFSKYEQSHRLSTCLFPFTREILKRKLSFFVQSLFLGDLNLFSLISQQIPKEKKGNIVQKIEVFHYGFLQKM